METDPSFALSNSIDIPDSELEALQIDARQWQTIRSLFRHLCGLTIANTDTMAVDLLDWFLSEQLQLIHARDQTLHIDRFDSTVPLLQIGFNKQCQVDGYCEILKPSMFTVIQARNNRIKASQHVSKFVFPLFVSGQQESDLCDFFCGRLGASLLVGRPGPFGLPKWTTLAFLKESKPTPISRLHWSKIVSYPEAGGNCWFRALAMAVRGDENHWQ